MYFKGYCRKLCFENEHCGSGYNCEKRLGEITDVGICLPTNLGDPGAQGGMSTGAIIGISVGGVAGIALVALVMSSTISCLRKSHPMTKVAS